MLAAACERGALIRLTCMLPVAAWSLAGEGVRPWGVVHVRVWPLGVV